MLNIPALYVQMTSPELLPKSIPLCSPAIKSVPRQYILYPVTKYCTPALLPISIHLSTKTEHTVDRASCFNNSAPTYKIYKIYTYKNSRGVTTNIPS